jgi:hypothetical protein
MGLKTQETPKSKAKVFKCLAEGGANGTRVRGPRRTLPFGLRDKGCRSIVAQGSERLRAFRIAGFQTGPAHNVARAADLEIGDTAGLETCATVLPFGHDVVLANLDLPDF